jgi:hypothetical protein
VSLLWRNHLRIGLCADRLLLAAYRPGLKPVKASQQVVPVQPSASGPEWRAALEAFEQILRSSKASEASVVIADQFVHYVLLPQNDSLKTDEQWLALARHRFTTVYGGIAAGWDVKITETSPAGPRLACALERELLEELASRAVAANCALVSVQPFLVAAFNQVNRKAHKAAAAAMGDGTCWLVVEEPGRLTLALLLRGVWTAIRSRRIDTRWRAALPQILERESAFLGLEKPCTSVVACTQGEFDAAMHEDFRTHAVDYRDVAMAWG